MEFRAIPFIDIRADMNEYHLLSDVIKFRKQLVKLNLMKKTISVFLQGKGLLMSFGLMIAMMFAGASGAYAQEVANTAANNNPYIAKAQQLGVTAYPLGTFDSKVAYTALTQVLSSLRPAMSAGTVSVTQRLKFKYCEQMVKDMGYNNVAVEITLLTSLPEYQGQLTGGGLFHPSMIAGMYNEIVALLQ